MMYRAAWHHGQSLPPVPSLWNSVRGASLRKRRAGSPPTLSNVGMETSGRRPSACSEDGNSVHVHIDQVSGIEFTVLDDREYSYCLVESWRKDINYGMTALEISSQKIEIFNQFRCFTGFPMGNAPVFISRCDSWSTFLLLFPYGITAQGTKHGRSYGHVQPFRTLLRRRLLLSRQYAVSVSGSMSQGLGRQHGGCLPSARQVPGPGTSAGKPRLSLSLSYTARCRWLALAIDCREG